jgi:hypothetical protein
MASNAPKKHHCHRPLDRLMSFLAHEINYTVFPGLASL